MKTLKIFKLISITFLSIFLASCSDDDSDSPATEQTSQISIKMVDAPGDFEHVYVDVQDVVSVMIQLMNSDIKNERFVLVAENWSLKKFTQTTAKALGVKPPRKEASSFLSPSI